MVNSTQRVDIDLGARSYPILIGPGLLDTPKLLASHVQGRAMVVTNDTLAPLYLERVMASLPASARSVILPDGEAYKNLETLDLVYEALLKERFDRGCTVVALGGGVVGDMAGYAAASYQRGVRYLQLPTTLLAQVDSSVGGKTGVNHKLGKNMIGAFHQPIAVLADMSTLDTLSDRELRAGLAEVIKYGLIIDADFFAWLESSMDALLSRDVDATATAVKRCCEIKADVVARDEHEHGVRTLLNLGHTFGHAIEASLGYGTWLHGEAVSAGMVMAMDLSQRLGWIGDADVERGKRLLQQAGLPLSPPDSLTPHGMLDYMRRDKKVLDGQMRLVLLQAIGQATVSGDYALNELEATLDTFCNAA